jgi:hypothetical protein
MTFSKPITGTFAFEGIIPSAAMNIINNAIPNALDKTGDNTTTSPTGGISGRIDVLNGGSILGQLGSQIGVETGGLLFVNGGEFNVVGAGQVNFGGDSSAATLNMFGSTITTYQPGAQLIFDNVPISGFASVGGIRFGTGSIQSSLSFSPSVGTVFIEQLAPFATGASGNTLWLIAQPGGSSSLTTGGTLILSGGVGGLAGGPVQITGGTGGTTPGNILLSSSSQTGAEIVAFSSMITQNWSGSNTGQAQKVIEGVWNGSSTASSSPGYQIASLAASQSMSIHIQYVFRLASNPAFSGTACVNMIAYNNAGSLSGSGGIVYGLAPSSGGSPPEPATDDIELSFGSGTSVGFAVNGNGYSGTYLWTVYFRAIII